MTLSEQIIAAVAAFLAVGLIVYSSYHHIRQLGYNEAVAKYEKQMAEDKKKTDAAQAQLQTKADQAVKDKQDAIQTADAKYTTLLNSLQHRTRRPTQTGSSAIAATPGTCSGAELYREDAEFLAGEAARADKVTIERDFYYERYEYARSVLAGTQSVGGQQGTVSNTKSLP